MTSTMRSLRLCLRATGRHASAPRPVVPWISGSRRPLSSTSVRWRNEKPGEDAAKDEEGSPRFGRKFKPQNDEPLDPRIKKIPDEEFQYIVPSREEEEIDQLLARRPWHFPEPDPIEAQNLEDRINADLEKTLPRVSEDELIRSMKDVNRSLDELEQIVADAVEVPRVRRDSFWNEEEDDQDLIVPDDQIEDFSEDDIMSMAHGKLEEFREYREYARVAAWQMPLLSKLAKPFVPPTAEECLRFRYTTYMGENHPAQSKVVVEFSPQDLPLSDPEKLKLRKLLGPRWNPETDIARISCEQFDHQAQNKRYLGDLVGKLIAQAKDHTDMFEDVPLDTRHHKFKVKPKFPREWRMTEERRRELEDTREKSRLLDQEKADKGLLVDGAARINQFLAGPVLEPKVAVRIPQRAGRYPNLSPSAPVRRQRPGRL